MAEHARPRHGRPALRLLQERVGVAVGEADGLVQRHHQVQDVFLPKSGKGLCRVFDGTKDGALLFESVKYRQSAHFWEYKGCK